MNLGMIRLVALKEGRELLRDRRTLFVNVVLPVLLYPLLAIAFVQLAQLATRSAADMPAVALIDCPQGLRGHLPLLSPADLAANGRPGTTRLREAEVGDSARNVLVHLAAQVAASGDKPSPATRAEVLRSLRALDLPMAVVILPRHQAGFSDGLRAVLLADNAHRDHPLVEGRVSEALNQWRKDLVQARLDRAGLVRDLIEPLATTTLTAAPGAEAVRSRLASIVPLLLLLMAINGAFLPALDLIAGERERGTLETLLSWPADRGDLFLGKLLVVIATATVSVLLNLASLGVTAALLVQQATPLASGELLGGLALGAGTLGAAFLVLLPLVITLSTVSLAVAGLAKSFKEGQNYLAPLVLVLAAVGAAAVIPDLRPSWGLDLLPVVGPLLALEEALQSSDLPWGHLLLTVASSTVVGAVVVSWSVRLLDRESFLYPGLVRAGWGRFRRWGPAEAVPGGLEALGVFAVCAGLFVVVGPLLGYAGGLPQVVAPLLAAIALPPLLHCWLGDHDPQRTLFLARPAPGSTWRTLLLVPACLGLSSSLGLLQIRLFGLPPEATTAGLDDTLRQIRDLGGPLLLVAAIGVVPGFSEELLCRGVVLSGLRRSLGPVAAVLISAFVFAALHLSPWRFLPQIGLGVVLALTVLRTGSIYPAMIIHALHNGLIVLGDDGSTARSNKLPHEVEVLLTLPWPFFVVPPAFAAWVISLALRRRRPRPG